MLLVLLLVPAGQVALAVDARDRQNLAIQIRDNSRITLNTSHPSGVQDAAYARLNIIDTANGGQAMRSNYGTAPGGSTWLDPRLLDCMVQLAVTYTYGVTEIAGADHSVGSRHYSGLAFDVYGINGIGVSSSNPHWQEFLQRCRDMGATETLGPGDSGHDTHVHIAWTDNGGNVAPSSTLQFSQQGPKLVGTGAIGNAAQGLSVSLSADGNTAIVGGYADKNFVGVGVGAAWVWTRSGGVWSQQAKLVGAGAVGNAFQGYSVFLSADGNTAIVGGIFDDSLAGAAWIWTKAGGIWTQQGTKLVGSDAGGVLRQGYSVSLSADGNTAIVGGYEESNTPGAAWVWTRSGGTWTQQGTKLVGSGTVGIARQGASVSLSADGNTAIIGGIGDNSYAGAAWVWTRSGGVWTQQGTKLVGSGAVGNAQQGQSVSLSADGKTALVGGISDNSSVGAVWVWTRSGGVWTQQGTKLVGSGAVGIPDYHGYSVSLSADGNTAITGAVGDNSNAGAVWVWTRTGEVWTQQGTKLVGSGAVGDAEQGVSVSLSADGKTAIVGGFADNNYAGAAWVFTASAPPTAPSFITPPVSQTVNAGQNVSFTGFAIGTAPLSYQWQFNNVPIAGATSATLTLTNVQPNNNGRYSVRVSNAVGSITSQTAILNVLGDPTGGVPPTNPATTYSPPPTKQASKDSLILITHGWQPLGGYENWLDNTGWVDDMANSISQNLISRGSNNWQVVPYKWLIGATGPFPWLAQVNGYNEGQKVGQAIVNQGWTNVHLIGQSAGAALVHGALETIKSKAPGTVVHTTFLDPYVGPGTGWRSAYGVGADWSDNYFSIDLTGSTTEGALVGAYNVDVTWLDSNKRLNAIYSSSPSSTLGVLIPIGYQAMSSHPWPHDFYQATVTNGLGGTEGLGFPLSKEGGGWNNRGNYPRGLAPRVLGDMPVLSQGLFPVRSDPSLTLNLLLSANSGNGTVQVADKRFDFLTLPPSAPSAPQSLVKSASVAGTGTAAWLSIGVPVTNKVNFVSFDAQFTSAAGAAGLFTVYWNTNQIGVVDESVTLPGWHSYTFALPGAFDPDAYTLGFRLDAFSATASSMTVTNVATGFSGLTNAVAMNVMSAGTNASPALRVTGAAGYNYVVEATTNFVTWEPVATLMNTNGTVDFVDTRTTNFIRRFYRAVVP